ncbi:hypothetical protein C8R44DRAFT_740230 [Mycena epipterygia]|nr:hypothetical protein C8R44DRAFT_740230 [Mycena epipterygia]
MLLECTECQLPYYNWEDLEEHYEVTHPVIHRENNRLGVRIIKRILNKHLKTYRCPHCFMPFPHPELRDSHVELSECDPEDSDCEKEECYDVRQRRGSLESVFDRVLKVRDAMESQSSSQGAVACRLASALVSNSVLESASATVFASPYRN